MIKKLFVLSGILFLVGTAFGQGSGVITPASSSVKGEKDTGKITGTVVDSDNNQPVEFATVALMKAGSETPVDGTVCDDKGKFTINKVVFGEYSLVISFVGYETQTLNNIVVSEKNNEVEVGAIKLSTGAKILKEVVVEGQKAVIEERVDRTIYNAENDQTARGGDATDVLKRVPMLSVDMDGNVSMRGSQNVTVLINNKPSSIMASSIADALKQIPADQIKSVEVITSPSAKYDAEGSAGIINIITKKNTLQGLTLNIDAGAGTRGSNLGLNGNYRKKNMGFSLGGFGRANYNVKGSFENNQNTYSSPSDQTVSSNVQTADTRSQGLFGNYTLGWDYDINAKNSLTAQARLGARNQNNFQDNLYTVITNETGEKNTLQDVETKDHNNNLDFSLTYTHLYEKPQRELSIMGNFSRNNRDSNFENMTRQANGSDTTAGYRNINDSFNQEMTIQVDYQNPIKDNQMIEFGGKDISRKVFSDYTYASLQDGSFVPSTSPNLSNNLNYDQNIVAGYLSYTYSTKTAYSFKAGARYEYTTINAYTQTEDNIEIPEYGALVPSLNISKKLASGKTIKAAYNRRIQRPSMRFLNPNIQASNPYDISYGNPNLDPEYSNNFEIAYSTFIKGTTLNFSTFWRNTNNSIQEVRDVLGNDPSNPDTVRTTYKNIGQEDAVGLNVFANVNIGKLTLNGGADLYYSMLNNNMPVDPVANPEGIYTASNEGWVTAYRMFGSYNLTKGWGFQFFGFYRGRQIQLQGTQGGFGIYSLGLKKDFNNKKGSVGFGAENFFNTDGFKIKSEVKSPLVNRESLTVLNNMSFRVNVSYRIGKMSMEPPKRRRSINNDDLKEGGDNGGGMDSGNSGGGAQRGGGGGFSGGNRAPAGGAAVVAAKPANVPPSDAAAVVNAEGTWNYTIDSPQGGEGTLVLKKEGEKYTGTINNKRFNRESTLSSVELKGNELTFSYDVAGRDGNTMTIVGKGVITGDSFTGTMSVGQFGSFSMQAKKAQ